MDVPIPRFFSHSSLIDRDVLSLICFFKGRFKMHLTKNANTLEQDVFLLIQTLTKLCCWITAPCSALPGIPCFVSLFLSCCKILFDFRRICIRATSIEIFHPLTWVLLHSNSHPLWIPGVKKLQDLPVEFLLAIGCLQQGCALCSVLLRTWGECEEQGQNVAVVLLRSVMSLCLLALSEVFKKQTQDNRQLTVN